MSNTDELTGYLIIAAIVIGFLIVVLGFILFVISYNRKVKSEKKTIKTESQPTEKSALGNYTKESIFSFIEFDKIEDNMICQKKGTKFLMGIECQGVNYDLMSGVEKNAVEDGFVQFLNTLRSPIQIYVQTRTVNLGDSIAKYKETIEDLEKDIERRQRKYEQMISSGRYPEDKLQKEEFEITKQNNLLEYGKDVIFNTEKMSLNKNILKKQYYIIVSYSSLELGSHNFSKDEIQNIAFSELYTKAQSIIRALQACEVNGVIMDSYDLIDLLYVAYNRDEAETYGLGKALLAGYDEPYSTSPDVVNKKIDELNKKIEEHATELANEKILQAKTDLEKMYEEAEKNIDELIEEMAANIIEENATLIGQEVADQAIENIKNPTKDENLKGGNTNEKEKRKITRKAV